MVHFQFLEIINGIKTNDFEFIFILIKNDYDFDIKIIQNPKFLRIETKTISNQFQIQKNQNPQF